MTYPRVLRDNIDFSNDSDICNLGFYEGEMNDKRPIRCEFWYTQGVNMMTIFISSINLKSDAKTIIDYLEKNSIVKIINNKITLEEINDLNDNSFYVINVPLNHGDEIYNENLVKYNVF